MLKFLARLSNRILLTIGRMLLVLLACTAGALLWLGIGWVLAHAYTFLAGGATRDQFETAVLFSPLCFAVLLVAAVFVGIFWSERSRFYLNPDELTSKPFLGILVLLTLPIWLNLASLGMRFFSPKAASFLYQYRYDSIPVTILAAAVLLVLWLLVLGLIDEVRTLFQKIRGNPKVPSS